MVKIIDILKAKYSKSREEQNNEQTNYTITKSKSSINVKNFDPSDSRIHENQEKTLYSRVDKSQMSRRNYSRNGPIEDGKESCYNFTK